MCYGDIKKGRGGIYGNWVIFLTYYTNHRLRPNRLDLLRRK